MEIANTYGWDTVYGIRFSDVNAVLTRDYRGYTSYTHTTTEGLVLSGDMKPWTLSGGSGRLLIMEVRGDSVTLDNYPIPGASATRTNVVYQVEVELELIPRPLPESSRPEDGQPMDLVLKQPRVGGPEMVQQTNVVGVDWDGYDPTNPSDPDQMLATAVRLAMTEWFNGPSTDPELPAPMASFQNVFATVNLNQRITDADQTDDDPFDWISPSAATYGVFSSIIEGHSDGILAIMCMGKDRADLAADLGNTVSPALLPAMERGGFLINKDRFLEHMLLPGLGLVFANDEDKLDPDWPARNFATSGNGTRLENTSDLTIKQLNIAGVDKDGNPEDPEYVEASIPKGGVQISITDTELEVRYQNLQHLFGKGLFGYAFNIFHQITVKTTADFVDDQFVLVPGMEVEDEGSMMYTHDVSLEQTDEAKTWDIIFLAIDILFFALSAFAAVKGGSSGAKAVKTADTAGDAARAGKTGRAALVATARRTSAPSRMQTAARGTGLTRRASAPMRLQAARQVARSMPAKSAWSLGFRHVEGLTSLIGLGIGGYLIAKDVFSRMMSDDELKALSISDPRVFASRVMKPIEWPGAVGFEIDSVSFNGGLHILGTPTFAEDDGS